MKKRTQLIILSVLIFVVIFVVLSSSIFSFSEIGVDYLTTTVNLNISNDSLFDSSKLEYGKSIFFINKKSAQKNIEKENPYIKVVNIETVFPNKLIFHVAERAELFVVNYNGNYLILDDEGKILDIKNSYINTAENAILLNKFNVNDTKFYTNNDTVSQTIIKEYYVGEFITNTNGIKVISKVLKEWETSFVHLRAHIVSVEIENSNLIFNMRCGLQIKIYQRNLNLSNKVNLAFSIYDKVEDIENKTLLEIRSVKNANDEYEIKGFLS